ncbi:MAG: hypothetical protein RL417_2321 [Pseudomonadota bacterium]|jgi:hypothetical protein
MKYEELGKGVVRRTEKRVIGLFIDGTGLDRATRRINRKVDMASLVRGVTSGTPPVVARYYTLIPYEDDSRQRAFLDAVTRAGLRVVVKRLPPKGVNRQVSVDIEMAADMVAFSLGHSSFSSLSEYSTEGGYHEGPTTPAPRPAATPAETAPLGASRPENRIITVVCPSRDLAYPISLVKELGVDTISADFGQFNAGDVLKSAAKWIDLSDSETIWRE